MGKNDKTLYFAVKRLIFTEGKFLIVHKSRIEEDLWELPGGRMEFGETAEETLIREMNEETGLRVKAMKVLDTWNNVRENYQITGIIYGCKLEDENANIRLSEEHDRYWWITPDEFGFFDQMHKSLKERMTHWDWDELRHMFGQNSTNS